MFGFSTHTVTLHLYSSHRFISQLASMRHFYSLKPIQGSELGLSAFIFQVNNYTLASIDTQT